MLSLSDLYELARQHADDLHATVREFSIGDHGFFSNTKPSIMGVINLSPDSWYRESVCLTTRQAVRRALVLQAQGADLIDLGAESTLAHAQRLDAGSQLSKLLPLLSELKSIGLRLSVETYDPELARKVLEAGAMVLNLTGNTHNEEMFRMAADHDAAVIYCYVQGPNPREAECFDFSRDPIDAMKDYFAHGLETADRCGLKKIFIDPGLGFYYRNLQDSDLRVKYQVQAFLNTFRLRTLGAPVCHALPHAFERFGEEVRSAEPFFAVLAALGKTDLFRTHEVARVKAVLDTMAFS